MKKLDWSEAFMYSLCLIVCGFIFIVVSIFSPIVLIYGALFFSLLGASTISLKLISEMISND